jgi:serine/threonine protein kinase
MAAVYAAVDESTGRPVAVKRLLDREDRRAAALFQSEFHVLSQLRHPRIIEVYAYGVDDLGPYYSMELLDGDDLRALAPVAPNTACELLRDIASSLGLLHARRLIHRDVTPRNVRRGGDGRCKLLDFGAMAPFGVPSEIIGTPPFVAPEVVGRDSLDQRADLYSMGATAYWLVTGRHAFPAKTISDLRTAWGTAPAAPSAYSPSVPSSLRRVGPAAPPPPLPLPNRRHHSVASNQAAQALLPLRRLRRGSLQPHCHDPRRDRADPTNNQNTACLACVPPPPLSPTTQIHQRAAIQTTPPASRLQPWLA